MIESRSVGTSLLKLVAKPVCALALVSLSLFGMAGCSGGDKVKSISGKIVAPSGVKLAETDTIELLFKPEAANSKTVTALVSKDLSFTAKVPPGKYKLQLTIKAYPGDKESPKRNKDFEAVNKPFGASTPLAYEVTGDGNQKIIVDMEKKTVTKD